MDAFVAKHAHAIRGVLSCFDRVLFRGSVLEPCRTFSLVWKEAHPFVQPAWRKCLHLYFYFLDRQLGLIHVKLQTWFPFPLQVYVNGHEWLAHRSTASVPGPLPLPAVRCASSTRWRGRTARSSRS